jgi:arylsulfatase A
MGIFFLQRPRISIIKELVNQEHGVQRSLKFIDENKGRPFFLYVPFNIPHYPEQALKKHEALYKDVKDPARRSYGAIVTTTDYYIGQVIDKLEEHGLRENTIVIYMSDNGHSEETGNRIRVDNHKSGYPKDHFYGASGGGSTGKWIGQKGSFLEGGVRVPAIISYPAKLPKGAVRGQIITAMDWFPTVLSLCGVKQPAKAPKLDGFNLHPIIHDAKAQLPRKTLHFAWGNKWAIREGDWKLIGTTGRPQVTLHNLADAKPEVKNYAKDKPKLVDRLRMLHTAWVKDVTPKRQ